MIFIKIKFFKINIYIYNKYEVNTIKKIALKLLINYIKKNLNLS